MKHAVAAVCAVEAFAIWGRRHPPFTQIGARHPSVAVGLVVGLAVHFAVEIIRLRRQVVL